MTSLSRFASLFRLPSVPIIQCANLATKAGKSSSSTKPKKSKKKGKNAGGSSHIPRELTQLRHALFTRPFKSGKEEALKSWVASDEYTRIATAHYEAQAARQALIVQRLQRQRERMAEACAALEEIDPVRFKLAMHRAPGEAQLIPMQKRMPTDTPATTIWEEDYKPRAVAR